MKTRNTAIVAPPAMLAVWNMVRCFDAANIKYLSEFNNKRYNYTKFLCTTTIIHMNKAITTVPCAACITTQPTP